MMSSQLKKTLNLKNALVFCFVLIVAGVTNAKAQTCPSILLSKSGTALSVRPAVAKKRATTNNVTVRVKKTGGRAETQVNIYINNVIQPPKKMEFDNGNDTPTKVRQLSGVRGKEIKVEIVNQSVGNKFKYKLDIQGRSSYLAESKTGKLMGQQNKTIITKPSCTGKTEIVVERTNGKARGNIRVWQKVGANWVAMNNLSETLEKSERIEKIPVNSNKALKIELRNVSVGNTLSYKMYAKVKN